MNSLFIYIGVISTLFQLLHGSYPRYVTSQFSIWMFIIDHSYASMIYAFCLHLFYLNSVSRNLKQLKDQLRELEVSQQSIFDLAKFGKLDQIVFKILFQLFQNKERRKMTS